MDLFFSTFTSYSQSILPWFILGAIIAFVVDRSVNFHIIQTLLGKITTQNILLAQAVGMVSPLSIMSALPISGELIRLGAQPLMLLIFLIAERAYDLQSFFIISNLFGIKIAAINAIIIFVSLTVSALYFKKENFQFISTKTKEKNKFWQGQFKTLIVVIVGITLGAALRVIVPLTGMGSFMTSWIGGVITSLVLGFGLYFGTILGNYPVAKSLADLGMSPVGILVFLSVAPIFNLVVMTLFISVVKSEYVLKIFGMYTLSALILSLIFSLII